MSMSFIPGDYMDCCKRSAEPPPAHFLDACYLCNKRLAGRDIFMYRGDAFCSEECRDERICAEEHKLTSKKGQLSSSSRHDKTLPNSKYRANAGTVAAA